MGKIFKKSISVMTALLMVSGVFCSTINAFAANGNVPSTYNTGKKSIVGQVDLSKVSYIEGQEVEKDGKLFYEGSVGGSVEASDLFEGAYDKFVTDFKGQKELILFKERYYENLVMFDYDKQFLQ